MGKLFAAVLASLPIAAFAIWAYLAQTERVWNEADLRQIELKIERAEFDLDYYTERGDSDAQIERIKKRLDSLYEELEYASAEKRIHTERGKTAIETIEQKLDEYEETAPDPLKKFNK